MAEHSDLHGLIADCYREIAEEESRIAELNQEIAAHERSLYASPELNKSGNVS